jgi:hypothetical protein
MKKVLSLLLLFVFLISTNGIIIYNHYCSNKKNGTTIYNELDKDACCGTTTSENTCCSNEFRFFKIAELVNSNHDSKFTSVVSVLPLLASIGSINLCTNNFNLIKTPYKPSSLFKLPYLCLAFLSVFRI